MPGTHLAPGLYVKKSLASANAKPVHDDDNGTILTCHSVGDASGDTVFVLFVNGKRATWRLTPGRLSFFMGWLAHLTECRRSGVSPAPRVRGPRLPPH